MCIPGSGSMKQVIVLKVADRHKDQPHDANRNTPTYGWGQKSQPSCQQFFLSGNKNVIGDRFHCTAKKCVGMAKIVIRQIYGLSKYKDYF